MMDERPPRDEYPRMQMKRESYVCLNGEWDFEFDFSKSGLERGFYGNKRFSHKILVPFCPESKLSGIEFRDFMPAVWYKRAINIAPGDLGKSALLHFGAVDYMCRVFVNGMEAGTHFGGYSSFYFDIGGYLHEGENELAVYAEDDTRSFKQPRGKQSFAYHSRGCDYTRTTGIWQTVWLEFVSRTHIEKLRIFPDYANTAAVVFIALTGGASGMSVYADAFYNGRPAGSAHAGANGGLSVIKLDLTERHVWNPGSPELYELKIRLKKDDAEVDSVGSYFGLRSVTWKNGAMALNGKPLFQRLALDQGFYPDGIYTAPSDEDLARDIRLSQELGFNGARLHQKAFEERFLYHADRMGYLVWGEHASWGIDYSRADALTRFLPEWLELVERDFNHPAIIGWCPFNETWDVNGCRQDDEVLRVVFRAAKAVDPTRSVIDTSGNFHVETDIYDVHDYEQDVNVFQKRYANLKQGEIFETHPDRQKYGGQPYFISEYGGTWWNPASAGTGDSAGESWGYGMAPKSEEEFVRRYAGLTGALLQSQAVCGFCYTQLYDVEQEQNGLYTYSREKKFSDEAYKMIKAANTQKAAVEGPGYGQ